MHAILGTAAVYGTLQAKEQLEKPKAEKVEFVEMKKKDEPPPPKEEPPPPKDVVDGAAAAEGIPGAHRAGQGPDVLPDIDLSKKVTDEADFSGKGVAGGIAKGVVGGTAPVNTDQPYFEFQVEKQVAADPRARAAALSRHAAVGQRRRRGARAVRRRYHGPRRDRHASRCSSPATSCSRSAVKNALPQHALLSGRGRRRKVKQLVQQPFTFSLSNELTHLSGDSKTMDLSLLACGPRWATSPRAS